MGTPLSCAFTVNDLRNMNDAEFATHSGSLSMGYAYSLGYRDPGGTIRGPCDGPQNVFSQSPIMADRPPADGAEFNSINHGGDGQNVLFADGHRPVPGAARSRHGRRHLSQPGEGGRGEASTSRTSSWGTVRRDRSRDFAACGVAVVRQRRVRATRRSRISSWLGPRRWIGLQDDSTTGCRGKVCHRRTRIGTSGRAWYHGVAGGCCPGRWRVDCRRSPCRNPIQASKFVRACRMARSSKQCGLTCNRVVPPNS